jgi:hypothetical protein
MGDEKEEGTPSRSGTPASDKSTGSRDRVMNRSRLFHTGVFIPFESFEDRIAGRINSRMGQFKPIRLIEGSTAKEFAEKLGIKPKDVVTLLLQRGVFCTLNQPLPDDVAADLGKRFGYDVTLVPFEEMSAAEDSEEMITPDAGLTGTSVDDEGLTRAEMTEHFELLSFKMKEVLTDVSLAYERLAKDWEEIEQLKLETRVLLKELRAE